MKKTLCVLLALALFLALLLTPALAVELYNNYYRVTDDAGLMSEAERSKLESRIEGIQTKYSFDVLIVTTPDFGGGDVIAWADQLYASNDFGAGENRDGLMFTISMAERDWGLTEYGYGAYAFNTYGRGVISDAVVSYLSDGDYYGAFDKYLDMVEEFLDAAGKEKPYAEDNPYRTAGDALKTVLISFVLALIISFVIVLSWKRGMNTRQKNDYAADYLVGGSFKLAQSRDVFLYRNVSRIKREKEKSSSGGGGGGGGSHGSSGKF